MGFDHYKQKNDSTVWALDATSTEPNAVESCTVTYIEADRSYRRILVFPGPGDRETCGSVVARTSISVYGRM